MPPPHASRPYSIPKAHLNVFKTELDCLVSISVLEPCGRSDWISGTVIIPKKDGEVRWISDFRALNAALKRKVYPLPKIADVLSRHAEHKFLPTLDLSMMHYTIELDDESQQLCTIATPYGLCK